MVFEKMVAIVCERGLFVCIYWLGRIMVDSNMGISRNRVFFLIEFLRVCIFLGKYFFWLIVFEIVLVDYVS